MHSLRDIKLQARRDVHEHAHIPALYISPTGQAIRLLTVRLHSKNAKIGGLVSDKNFAERVEVVPRILCMINQIKDPKRGAIFSIAKGEAYKVERNDPFDTISVTAICTRLDAADAKDLPFPLSGADSYDPANPSAGHEGRIEIPFAQPSTDWSVLHNLGYYPQITTFDGDGEQFEAVVEHIDNTTVKITVDPPRSGVLRIG